MDAGIRWRWRESKQAEPPDAYAERIGELADILDGVPWVLGGGLAIPFTRGEFHRVHTDVDLLFEERHFPAIHEAFVARGYELWQHYTMSLFGAFTGAVHVRLRPDSLLARIRRRKLKYRDATGRRGPSHLLASVDALPYRIVDGQLRTCDGRHRFSLVRPVVGHRARSAAGHEIPCLDLEYVARLKGPRREARDIVDFALIRDAGLLPEGDWGV